ncbi:MAG: epoxyqueuosine reductase QueH [Dehalococcoidales bacterium]
MNKDMLLHVCCAHCAAYTVNHWRNQGYRVTAFWYNPNIHPYQEYLKRLEAVQTLTREMDFPLVIAPDYDITSYFRMVAGDESERCRHCFHLRLGKTAMTAREMGLAGFSSTLLISPHQRHDILREIGEAVAVEAGSEFLYADLRKRYSDSRHLTKPLEIYRQQYCGCLYSEWERYRPSESH